MRNFLGATESQSALLADLESFLTLSIDDKVFGIPVLKVQDILVPHTIAVVPLAPPDIRGSINLRGRVVTVIDVRVRLGLPQYRPQKGGMGITVEHQGDLYTLLVDKVGDVISLPLDRYEANPSTLDPLWRSIASGVYRLEDSLMVVLDVSRLLTFNTDIL